MSKIDALENSKEPRKKSAPYGVDAIHRNRHKRAQLHAQFKKFRKPAFTNIEDDSEDK